MRTLITGASGFIGSHLHTLLPEADGWDIKEDHWQDIRIKLPQKAYTHIFHLAALRSAPLGEKYPFEFISTNCWGTINILKTYPNTRILNITSASAEKVKGIYGATKKFSELVGALYPNVVNVRPYNIFGEGQPLESQAVIPLFINAYLKGEKPIVYGDGLQMRDFTYVGDLVQELKRIMFEEKENKLFHCGYSEPVSISMLLSMIWGKSPEVETRPSRPFDIEISKAPYSIKKYVGREEGLKRTIEWWKNQLKNS